MTSRTCPVCGTPLGSPVERSGSHSLLSCPHCDLQVWDPPESADATWYDNSDHYLAMPIVDWLGWYHRWAIANLPRNARTLLDIGCADGRFVYAVARRGVDARGIDHAERLIREGNARYGGSRLQRASIEDLTALGRTFDVVTMFEVIEHVVDPLALLRIARPLVRPGGTIMVSTPNRLGSPRADEELDRPPHHLTRWSTKALRAALAAGGYQDIYIDTAPPEIGVREFIIRRMRFGVVRALLRRRAAHGASTPERNADVRRMIRAKDLAADASGRALAPLIGKFFRDCHLAAFARRPITA
jgi:SAM-dependent methyltransferase